MTGRNRRMSGPSPVRVLIVEDNPHYRERFERMFSKEQGIEVVGTADNGQTAIASVLDLAPDLVTMDLDMPVMDGLQAISNIMSIRAVPILVITEKQGEKAVEAISRGALEVVLKHEVTAKKMTALVKRIQLLASVCVIRRPRKRHRPAHQVTRPSTLGHVIAVAASTGGPSALVTLINGLPQSFSAPIIVAQHIGEGFVEGMVKWLQQVTRRSICQARPRQPIEPGRIYLAPADHHLTVAAGNRFQHWRYRPQDIYRPSCDILLKSVASIYAEKSIGIVLTGMGHDGAEGILDIHNAKGHTIAQDESTSIIFGMPRKAIETGAIDVILPIDQIASEIVRLTG